MGVSCFSTCFCVEFVVTVFLKIEMLRKYPGNARPSDACSRCAEGVFKQHARHRGFSLYHVMYNLAALASSLAKTTC